MIANANSTEMEGNQEEQITKINDHMDTHSKRFKGFKDDNNETLRKVFTRLSPQDRKKEYRQSKIEEWNNSQLYLI